MITGEATILIHDYGIKNQDTTPPVIINFTFKTILPSLVHVCIIWSGLRNQTRLNQIDQTRSTRPNYVESSFSFTCRRTEILLQ